MPVLHAVYLLVAIVLLIGLTERARLQPFLAVTAVALAFGFAADMSISLIGKAFGAGFVDTLQSVGLVIVAGSLIGALARHSGASARLASMLATSRRRWGLPALMAPLGLVAGLAASPAAAFAALTPFRQAMAGLSRRENAIAAISLGLSLAASNGMVLPAPAPIAAMSILGADPARVIEFGLPAVFVAILAGLAFARVAGHRLVENGVERDAAPRAETSPASARALLALLLPVGLMILLLIVQSIGEIPSEPLGGASTRELLLGVGRAPILLAVGVGVAALLSWRWRRAVISDEGWAGQAIAEVAGLILLVGAGGGFQRLIQETGTAELLAERVLDWPVGLLMPFAVAAILKTLQGSSLVAVIAAAGMVEPALAALGLDGTSGRALAVVAIGAGATTASHFNDGYFWLVAGSARLRPAAGLALLGGGSLIQGLTALAVIVIVGALAG